MVIPKPKDDICGYCWTVCDAFQFNKKQKPVLSGSDTDDSEKAQDVTICESQVDDQNTSNEDNDHNEKLIADAYFHMHITRVQRDFFVIFSSWPKQ